MTSDFVDTESHDDVTTEDEVRGIIQRARQNGSEDMDMYERLVLMLAQRVDRLEDVTISETERVKRSNSNGLNRVHTRMDEVEAKIELLSAKKNLNLDMASELSVMELRLLQGHEFRRVDERRAAILAKNIRTWANEGTTAGVDLSAKQAGILLNEHEGVDLHPKVVHRAMEELAKQSGGKIRLVKKRGQKFLRIDHDEIWCPTEKELINASPSHAI